MRTLKSGLVVTVVTIGLLAGSAVGTAARDDGAEAAAPAFFSWTVGDVEDWEMVDGTFEEDPPGIVKLYGGSLSMPIEADDPRASGRWTQVENRDDVFLELGDEDEQVITLAASSQRLANDGGSWSGTGTLAAHSPQYSDDELTSVSIAMLTGEGGYEGLTLVLATSVEGSWGWIVPSTSVPSTPEPSAE